MSRLMMVWDEAQADPTIMLMVPANPPRKKSTTRRPFIFQYLDLLGIDSSRVIAYEGEKYRYAAETLIYPDWRNQASRPGMHFCPPRGALLKVRAALAPKHLPLQERPH